MVQYNMIISFLMPVLQEYTAWKSILDDSVFLYLIVQQQQNEGFQQALNMQWVYNFFSIVSLDKKHIWPQLNWAKHFKNQHV